MVALAVALAGLFAFFLAICRSGKAGNELTLQARLSPCDLIKYHGYPCDRSYVTTDDGYVLEMDHIPYGRGGSPSAIYHERTPRYPVLLLPVFTSASDMWFLNYPWQSPGFLLVDRGFDVWSMNSREAKQYSNHTTLFQDDPRYWRWSFDEIGRYDLAACVDHVLEATGAPKLTIMALSQGVTITLVLLSTRPEYNEKIDLVIGYGPVANITHSGQPISVAMPLLPPVLLALDPFSRGGYLGASEGLQWLVTKLCEAVTSHLCTAAMTLTHLGSPAQINETRVAVYAGHWPRGTSIQNMRHFHQMYRAKSFVMYDHGKVENQRRYGQLTPPAYPLECIRTSFALFSSQGDLVADTRDVADLVATLGSNVILHIVVPQREFGHADFIAGYNANKFLHDVAIDIIQQHVQKSRMRQPASVDRNLILPPPYRQLCRQKQCSGYVR
uniref:Putative triglyceride lipase-cholesterol esterase n=1 Tax=Rhipicephalus microplus TaxID=6941 RepID=A0A6M2CXZ6_RHIMP